MANVGCPTGHPRGLAARSGVARRCASVPPAGGGLGQGALELALRGLGIAPTIADNPPRGLIASLGCWRSVIWRGQEQALQQADGGDYRGGVFRYHCIGQVVFVKMQMQAVGVGGGLFQAVAGLGVNLRDQVRQFPCHAHNADVAGDVHFLVGDDGFDGLGERAPGFFSNLQKILFVQAAPDMLPVVGGVGAIVGGVALGVRRLQRSIPAGGIAGADGGVNLLGGEA